MGTLEDEIIFHYNFGYPVGVAHPPTWMDGAPFYITTGNHSPLEEGMVFHVPASFRAFGTAGVGLSHTFVVEKDGTRVLTHGKAEVIDV
jgi:Xaa-Pro dipeptidase